MLEKIKTIPFVDESLAVKLKTEGNTLLLERSDRVTWAQEKIGLSTSGIDCYVEADKFFSLLPDIKEMHQTSCLEITLKNGAKYELPFLQVSWETETMPAEYPDEVLFKLDDLMTCTLKNLVRPELQCIYIDDKGAVSCDFVSACISTQVKTRTPFLLPADVQELVNGRQCKIAADEGKLYVVGSDFILATAKPTLGEDAWWETLRQTLSNNHTETTPTNPMEKSLRRLQLFDDYVSFSETKMTAGSNFEPFQFRAMPGKYEIEKLLKIVMVTKAIAASDENLVLESDTAKFLLSPMEE